MPTNETGNDWYQGSVVASAELQINTVTRYLEGLTRWFARYPVARRTFVSLFSNTGLIRNTVVRDLYKNACLTAFQINRPFDRYIYASLFVHRLAELQSQYEHYYQSVSSNVLFLTGDCNDLAHGIVGETTYYQEVAGEKPAPTVVFINPDELRMQWKTLQILARLPNLYLILFYPLDALDRLMPRHLTSNFTTEVDLFFGDSSWRDIYLRTAPNARPLTLLRHYQDQLETLGFRDIVNGYDLGIHWERAPADARLYAVMFIQKTPLPRSFWDELTVSPTVRPRGTGSLSTAPLTA